MTAPQPWERQPGESPEAWAAFQLYRDATGRRRAHEVALQSRKDESLIRRWSARWGWVDRAAAWDAQQDREWTAERLRQRRLVARRHAEIAMQLQGKGLAKLRDLTTAELTERGALRLIELGMAAEVALYGVAAPTEGDGGVKLVIDGRLLPPAPPQESEQ